MACTVSIGYYPIRLLASSIKQSPVGLFSFGLFPRTPKGQEVFHDGHAKALARSACIRRGRYGECAGGRPAATETQHPLHHGRRHRLDAAEHLSTRPDGRGNAEYRPHRGRRTEVEEI